MCNKISYSTKKAATKDAKRIQADYGRFSSKGRHIVKKLRPYDCPECEYWHLTSQKQHKKRDIRIFNRKRG